LTISPTLVKGKFSKYSPGETAWLLDLAIFFAHHNLVGVGVVVNYGFLPLLHLNRPTSKMPRPDVDQLDSQIARLRSGGTLTENEVKVLCDKVSILFLTFNYECRSLHTVISLEPPLTLIPVPTIINVMTTCSFF